MNGLEGIVVGAILAFLIERAWTGRDPTLLYVFAGFAALAGIASSTGYQPAAEAPYAWGIAISLVVAGVVVSRR